MSIVIMTLRTILSNFIFFSLICVEQQSLALNWNGDTRLADNCFCKLKGEVHDCSCKVETLDFFNNNKVYPRLKSLLTRNYFRYFRVNLNKGCPFWSQDNRCAARDCHVDICLKDEVPIKMKQEGCRECEQKYSKESNVNIEENCDLEQELSALNTTISDDKRTVLQAWKHHDEALPMFCEIEDELSSDLDYVDLVVNPERYTGYKGSSPQRIWKAIYEENCFKPERSDQYVQNLPRYARYMSSDSSMCLEKRVFYRLISGLHTSINVHLSDKYLVPGKGGFAASTWDHNLEEFLTRFDPKLTDGQGPQRLKNLYFTYLVELRALAKVSPYLTQEDFYTGDLSEDADLKNGILDLLNVIRSFPDHFNESELFLENTKEKRQLKIEFIQHFRNISQIMECVECEKCRLWGKLQVLGMGTALKILLSGDHISRKDFQLTRNEIVALFNAFGRLSSSIFAIETFRNLAEKPRQDHL